MRRAVRRWIKGDNIVRLCFDKRIIGGLALVGVGVYAVAPELLGAALPLLILAICPLSMLLMMKMMMPGPTGGQTPDAGGGGDEVATLRAEVDKLRGERAERGQFQPPAAHPG